MRDRQTAETGARPSTGNDRPVHMMQNEMLGVAGEQHEDATAHLIEVLRSAGTTGEKIVRAGAFSFLRGVAVGRAARMADESARGGAEMAEKQPA